MAEKAVSEKSRLEEQVFCEANKNALAEEEWEAIRSFAGAVAGYDPSFSTGWEGSHYYAQISALLIKLLTTRSAGEKSMAEKISQLDRRTLVHSSQLEKVEADIEGLKELQGEIKTEGHINSGQKWPPYVSNDFETIVQRTRELEGAAGGISQVLYCMIELERLLDAVANKARATGRKYEGRLAASLRDVCRIYEPDEISEEQAKRLGICVRALVEGWGDLNREKVNLIRSKLLEVGLTWLPVTAKAQKEIEEEKRLAGGANGESGKESVPGHHDTDSPALAQ
jgi:hypothetical protein